MARSVWHKGVGALAAVSLACGCASSGSRVAAGAGSWQQIASPPFHARVGAVAAWTGTEALFLGGDVDPPCPPGADCAFGPRGTVDGAAFDPTVGTWRLTMPAPAEIQPYSPHVMVGDTVFLWGQHRLMAYDASTDRWTVLPDCCAGLVGGDLASVNGLIAVVGGERRLDEPPGELYDPTTRAWRALPDDLLGATFDRDITGTPAGLLLTGHDLVPDPGVKPSFERAELLDPDTMTWRLLPDSDQLGGGRWIWTGTRLVDPALGGEDGGEVNPYGRTIPHGGTLDPAAGEWGRLPNAPAPLSGGWVVEASSQNLIATQGWIYDDRAETWSRLASPAEAPDRAGSAVWAGRRLIVVGGVDTSRGYTDASLVKDAWMLTVS